MSTSALPQWYFDTFYSNADYRIRDYPLMGLPHQFIIVAVILSIFSGLIVPRLFAKYKSLDILYYQIILFVVQVTATSYIIYHLSGLWLYRYNWICQPIDTSSSPETLNVIDISHKYFLYKLFSITEISYFLVKNRNKYWTKYIIFHHLTVPLFCWILLQHYPEGHVTFAPLINSLILNFLYIYGTISELFSSVLPKRWIRRLTSTLDELQFLIVSIHSGIVLFQKNCNIPLFVVSVELGYILMLVIVYVIIIKLKADKLKGDAF